MKKIQNYLNKINDCCIFKTTLPLTSIFGCSNKKLIISILEFNTAATNGVKFKIISSKFHKSIKFQFH